MSMFVPATREKLKLRMAIDGPSGSGKTYTALRAAFALKMAAPDPSKFRIAVADSEHSSARKYQGLSPDGVPWNFDVCELNHFAPTTYTAVIREAAAAGYDCLVIDSLSHAWDGIGGALDQVDRKSSSGGNSFTAWKDVTPQHREMIEAILHAPLHVISTMRSKQEYILEEQVNAKGKSVQVPKRVGMAAVQRSGMEYEFDVVIDMDVEHLAKVAKTRCDPMDGASAVKPGPAFFGPLIRWLDEGVAPAAKPAFVPSTALQAAESAVQTQPNTAPAPAMQSGDSQRIAINGPCLQEQVERIKELAVQLDMPREALVAAIQKRGAARLAELTFAAAQDLQNALQRMAGIEEVPF